MIYKPFWREPIKTPDLSVYKYINEIRQRKINEINNAIFIASLSFRAENESWRKILKKLPPSCLAEVLKAIDPDANIYYEGKDNDSNEN